jgi:hypothetical protein
MIDRKLRPLAGRGRPRSVADHEGGVGQQSKFSYDALRASLMQRYSRCGSPAWPALGRSVPAEPIVQTRADSVDLGDLDRSRRDVHILDLRTQVRSKAVLDSYAQSGTNLAP